MFTCHQDHVELPRIVESCVDGADILVALLLFDIAKKYPYRLVGGLQYTVHHSLRTIVRYSFIGTLWSVDMQQTQRRQQQQQIVESVNVSAISNYDAFVAQCGGSGSDGGLGENHKAPNTAQQITIKWTEVQPLLFNRATLIVSIWNKISDHAKAEDDDGTGSSCDDAQLNLTQPERDSLPPHILFELLLRDHFKAAAAAAATNTTTTTNLSVNTNNHIFDEFVHTYRKLYDPDYNSKLNMVNKLCAFAKGMQSTAPTTNTTTTTMAATEMMTAMDDVMPTTITAAVGRTAAKRKCPNVSIASAPATSGGGGGGAANNSTLLIVPHSKRMIKPSKGVSRK